MDPQNPPPPSSVPPMPPPSGQPPAGGQPYPFRPGGTPIAHQPSEAKPAAGSPKQEIVERLKQANNVLVTVSNNPSVDQLSACIGLTLMLNKLGKHATAVFSGAVPSTIEFLQPEKTIEKNTDSLRDFIIALDKAKADKLRYKVEDKYVKIFITPYKTSLSDKDLEFSQGDFNVEVVIALGVQQREQLDQAITAHGRILHDATVISVNNQASGELGAINWHESAASSLSELVVSLSESLQPGILDAQMATALLTGIVAETERFSNTKTSAVTMGIASQLMRNGANQQLIANKLEAPPPPPPAPKPEEKEEPKEEDKSKEPPKPPEPPKKDDGSLQIPHEDRPAPPPPPPAPDEDSESVNKINIDDQGEISAANETPPLQDNSKIVLTPPSMGGTLTANTEPENEEPTSDPLSLPPVNSPLLSHNPATPSSLPSSDFGSNTAVGSSNLDKAREEVNSAASKGSGDRLEPVASLGSSPIDLENKNGEANANGSASGNPPGASSSNAGTAPPVPPPMMPPKAP